MRRGDERRLWAGLLLRYTALLALLVGAAYLELYPAEVVLFPFYDTMGHFFLMGPLAPLLYLATGWRRISLLIAGLVVTAEEALQLLSPHRTFDWLDLRANLVGLLFFTWVADFAMAERQRYPSTAAFLRGICNDLLRFSGKVLLALLFPGFILLALAVTRSVAFPRLGLYRYDWLLLLFLAAQYAMVRLRLESPAELKIITLFHLIGLAMELFKVRMGSWAYPEPSLTKLLGVPLYSGFMYASVASFLIQVWNRLDLRLERWPSLRWVASLGTLIYLNFFTHHFTADIRWFLILGVCTLFFRSRVVLRSTEKERTFSLVGSFLGLGFFIWIAENLATYFGAWAYPNQRIGWEMVHIGKINAWSLLVIISFILVAELKRREAQPAQGQHHRHQAGY